MEINDTVTLYVRDGAGGITANEVPTQWKVIWKNGYGQYIVQETTTKKTKCVRDYTIEVTA